MKAIVDRWRTEIFPDKDEVFEHCKPGEGEDTCVWLAVGNKGFECFFYNRPLALIERWERGETSAKRNGCERVQRFDPAFKSGEVEVPE